MTILLGSSDPSVTRRWSELLSAHPVEKAATLAEVKRRCMKKTYDLILLHRTLVDIPVFAQLRRAVPSMRFFLLSDQPNEEEGFEFLKAGIAGYGNTYISPARLAEAVRIINSGGVWLGQQLIHRLILETSVRAARQETPGVAGSMAGLTRMERKVAEQVAIGRTNLEIAADLGIAERTVKAHLTSAYEKTQTGNRLGLALLINRGEK